MTVELFLYPLRRRRHTRRPNAAKQRPKPLNPSKEKIKK
jgi:hypothetical protein